MPPADKYGSWGPWLGVPKARQHLCAIDGCEAEGQAHQCPADGSRHFHGCVHYEVVSEALYVKHQLKLRNGWGLLCEAHYAIVNQLCAERGRLVDPTADAPRKRKTTVMIRVELEGDDADDAMSIIDDVLDVGVFQDAINDTDDKDIKVTSITTE